MRTQRTTKGIRDAGSSCLCDRGLHRYLRNFGGGGLNTPNPPPLGTPLWVENIKWNLTVSPVYVINKGRVIISLFEFISVCYMKPLEWAAVVEVSDLYHIFGRLGAGGGIPMNLMFCAQKF